MVPGVSIYPNGKEMRETRSTSLISIPKGNSSHMVVMDLNLFSRVFKYTLLSIESIFLPKQGQARGGILEV